MVSSLISASLLSVVCCVGVPKAEGQLSAPTATLPSGVTLTGYQSSPGSNVSAFTCVPYAEPPVGGLMFRPPVPHVIASDYDATKRTPVCVQPTRAGDVGYRGELDCLYLDVYAPVGAEGLPVAIYVPGGGYGTVSARQFGELAVDMAKGGRAIVVAVNYRLGPYGFLSTEEMAGNFGVMDQREAMAWVKGNIKAFGGDDERITIFGESAGGSSVSVHLSSPGSWGYFDRAIMESGGFSQFAASPASVADDLYQQVLSSTNCPDVSCLRSMPVEEFFPIAVDVHCVPTFTSGHCYSPVVDGDFLVDHPYNLVGLGQTAPKSVMIGTNSDEAAMFLPLSKNATSGSAEAFWRAAGLDDGVRSELEGLYFPPPGPGPRSGDISDDWYAAVRSDSDKVFTCPTARAHRELEGARRYLFGDDMGGKGFVDHTDELVFVFGGFEFVEGMGGDDYDRTVVGIMSEFWMGFVEDGDPQGGWVEDGVMVVDRNGHGMVETKEVRAEQCDFWESYIDAEMAEYFN